MLVRGILTVISKKRHIQVTKYLHVAFRRFRWHSCSEKKQLHNHSGPPGPTTWLIHSPRVQAEEWAHETHTNNMKHLNLLTMTLGLWSTPQPGDIRQHFTNRTACALKTDRAEFKSLFLNFLNSWLWANHVTSEASSVTLSTMREHPPYRCVSRSTKCAQHSASRLHNTLASPENWRLICHVLQGLPASNVRDAFIWGHETTGNGQLGTDKGNH